MRIFTIALLTVLCGCIHQRGTDDTSTASPSPEATATPATTEIATPAPSAELSAAPIAVPTGIVTVTFHDGTSYVGRFVSANAFRPCSSPTSYPFTSSDTALQGGQCEIAYSEKITLAVKNAFPSDGGPAPTVNSVAISADGTSAIATFVKGTTAGQVLLTQQSGTWRVAQAAKPGAMLSTSGAKLAGVSPKTLSALQGRLKFDVAAPAIRLQNHDAPSP